MRRHVLLPLLLLLGLISAAPAAPLTEADLAVKASADWRTLAAKRMHTFDLPDSGLKIQLLTFDVDLLKALLVPLSQSDGFPVNPASRVDILNAIKPNANSVVVYMAARDRVAEPSVWSPVFGVNHNQFHIRLTDGKDQLPIMGESVVPVSLIILEESKPMAPNEPWRALYALTFHGQDDLDRFIKAPRVMLQFDGSKQTYYLNVTGIRDGFKLDTEHSAEEDRSVEDIETFFAHFPPKEQPAPQ